MQRVRSIDIMKGLLTLGMIFAHGIQILAYQNSEGSLFRIFINRISFTGFCFCFGYVVNLAYYQNSVRYLQRSIRTILRCYIAYVLSGYSYMVIMSSSPGLEVLLKIATFGWIPGYSEFLATLTGLLLIAIILKKVMLSILDKPLLFFAVFFIILSSVFLPLHQYSIRIGLLIGNKSGTLFPILQYFPVFILGCYFSTRKITGIRTLSIFWIIALISFIFVLIDKNNIRRYPPNLVFIALSLGMSMFYYYISLHLDKFLKNLTGELIIHFGNNVLYYLIISNISFFILRKLILKKSVLTIQAFLIGLVVILTGYYLQWIIRKPSKVR